MIIKGGARSSGGFFAHHLMKAEENERVEVKEIRGLLADTVPEAFQEMRMVAAGTKAENYFYHASINPREDEHLTPEQWDIAVDRLEQNLGLTDHARFQVEHEKNGRTHRHIVWSRVDVDSMTVTPASGNYLAHDKTRLELEQEFSHEPTSPTPQPSQRKSREFADWENFRAADSGIDPKAMKAEITALWLQSDSGGAFQMAIEEQGYLLAKGDRRDFVLIDPAGDVHSLARRIDGAKAADIRAKMVDLDRDSLMSAKEASAWMKGKEEAENSGSSDARILPEEERQERELPSEVSGGIVPTVPPASPLSPKLAILEKYALDHPPELDPREAPYAQFFPDFEQPAASIYDRADQIEAILREKAASMTAGERAQHIEDNERAWQACFGEKEQQLDIAGENWKEWQAYQAQFEQARLARIAARKEQPSHDHDPPAGEPPVEPVSFERATRGIDPPQTIHEREAFKRDNETWAESVTRQKQERTKSPEKDKSDHTEPELER